MSNIADLPENTEGDRFSLKDHIGDAVILNFAGIKKVDTEAYGPKDAAEFATIRVINNDGTILTEYNDVLVFNAGVVSTFRRAEAATQYRAQVGSYKSKHGTTGYSFERPDDTAAAAIAKYDAANTTSVKAPF